LLICFLLIGYYSKYICQSVYLNKYFKTKEITMITRAAVALAAGQPLKVMDVNLEGPKSGEVLIEIKATGICHTDEFTRSGDDPEGAFPAILGHEDVVMKMIGLLD
jgi:hypothetical protein